MWRIIVIIAAAGSIIYGSYLILQIWYSICIKNKPKHVATEALSIAKYAFTAAEKETRLIPIFPTINNNITNCISLNDFLTEYTTPEFVKAYNVYINNLNDKDSIFYSNKKDIILVYYNSLNRLGWLEYSNNTIYTSECQKLYNIKLK